MTLNDAERRGDYLGGVSVGYGMGIDVYWVGRLGSEAHLWALCAFPLVLLSCPRIVRDGNFEQGCEGKLIPK